MLENKQKFSRSFNGARQLGMNAFKYLNSLQNKMLVLALSLALVAGTACVSWAWLSSSTGAITTGFSMGLVKIEASGMNNPYASEVMADANAVAGEQVIPGKIVFTNSSTRTVVVRIEVSTQSWLHVMDYSNSNAAPTNLSQNMEFLAYKEGGSTPALNTAAQIEQALNSAGLTAYLYKVPTSSGYSLYIQTDNLPASLQYSTEIIAQKIYFGSRHFRDISNQVSNSAPQANLMQFVRSATGQDSWVPEFDANGMVNNIPDGSGLRAYLPANSKYYYIALDNQGKIIINDSLIKIPESLGSGYGANENNIQDAAARARLNEHRARFSIMFKSDAVQGTTDAVVEVLGLQRIIANALIES